MHYPKENNYFNVVPFGIMHILGCPYAIIGLIAQESVARPRPYDYAMNYKVLSINMGTKMHI